MLKIRRPLGRLIFNMGIAIPGKTVFLIEMAPRALCRAGASSRCTSTSICNMCESEYLIITWVRVQVRVLVDEYEYKYEYWSMIYILYTVGSSFSFFGLWQGSPQILKNLGQSSNYLPIVNIYICLIILCNLIHWHSSLQLKYCDVLAVVADIYNLLPVQKQEAKIAQYHEMCGKYGSVFF